jgi:SNF2 family DNA or RNA helicase
VNLFIADDVGLGKTIEAGLILRELLMRQKVRRVVVAAPPSVVLQWRDELEQRFGLTFVIFDRDYVLACRRERGYGVNPWTTHSRFIISHALLRDEAYAARCATGSTTTTARGSLLILDEAHNAAPASGRQVRRRLQASPAPSASSPRASSTASSSRPPRTTGTPTAFARSSRSSTRSASAAV